MNKNIIFKGFTLVELIIVVTLLVLLTSISFIGFQGYTKSSRDTNRVTTMTNINNALNLYFSKTQKYPDPNNKITIQSSGSVIGYQGKFGSDVSRIVGIDTKPEDPIDKKEYLYYINQYSNKYELLGYLEGSLQSSYFGIENTYADMSSRTVKVLGNKLGIILDSFKDPIMGSSFDIKNISSTYNVYFSDNDYINSNSGNLLFSNILNRRNDLLTDKNILKLDDNLVGYWDMETLSGSNLKDLSKYGNDGIFNGGILKNQPGKIGNSIKFNGLDTYIDLGNSQLFNFIGSDFTYSYWIKLSTLNVQVIPLSKGVYQSSGWYSNIETSGYSRLLINGGGVGQDLNSGPSAINTGIWYNIIGIKNGNKGYLYVNGNLLGTTIFSINPSSSLNNLIIGRYSSSAHYVDGYIDDVRIYNRSISQEEVNTIYGLGLK